MSPEIFSLPAYLHVFIRDLLSSCQLSRVYLRYPLFLSAATCLPEITSLSASCHVDRAHYVLQKSKDKKKILGNYLKIRMYEKKDVCTQNTRKRPAFPEVERGDGERQ